MNTPASLVGRSVARLFSLLAGLLLVLPALRAAELAGQAQDKARLQAVVAFADHVLKDAADRYHPHSTPLLANGIDVYTKEQLLWHFPDGKDAVLSDFTVQQNFMRVLAALTNLTGDSRYKDAAKANYAYYFAHFQDEGGLLRWGGHCAIDLKTLQPIGPLIHELKNAYPYYQLMYEVNPEATVRYIKGFWNAHVYDWRTLEISRHGEYGKKTGSLWDSPFDDPKPFFETKGLSFLDAGTDLIYSAAMLFEFTGDRGALLWSKRLAEQYVKARNPVTKLGAYQYTQAKKTADTTDDNITLSWYGDRAHRQFGPEFGDRALEGTMLLPHLAATIYATNALMQIQLAPTLGPDGKQLLDWTHEGLAAFAHYAYLPEKNLLRPMLTDGTDLSNFALKRNGYYGRAGTVLAPYRATPEFMLSYARAFLVTGDPALWAMARGIAQANDLGEIGTTPGQGVAINLDTRNDDARALFSVLDLYRQTHQAAYLQLARAIGNNIVKTRFHHGYFTRFEDQIYANIDAIEPYALLALDAAIKGRAEQVPYFINGSGFFDTEYRFPDGTVRRIQDGMLYFARKSRPLAAPPDRFASKKED
jgi:pectate lyase